MWDLIAFAAGIGFGLMGLAAYIKTNFEARKDAKDYKNEIRKLQEIISEGQRIDPSVLIQKEKDLIDSAKYEIWILGINALGVFHESFENIISFIERGGKVRVLLLDPESEAFSQRERKEEGNGKEKSGRLKAEYVTSVAFCKDIDRLSNNRDSLELKVYNEAPEDALLLADPQHDTGIIHINEYNPELIRGYIGVHRYIIKEFQTDLFSQWLQKYKVLWDNAEKVMLYEK
jgi:hypothetical protein